MGLSASQIATLYPEVKDCFAMDKQINILRQDMNYYYSRLNDGDGNIIKALLAQREELYNVSGCKKTVLAKLEADNKAILDKYSDIAKTRIESDSFSTRNVYIALAGITLVSAGLLIYKYKN